jgi:hypothetical protein
MNFQCLMMLKNLILIKILFHFLFLLLIFKTFYSIASCYDEKVIMNVYCDTCMNEGREREVKVGAHSFPQFFMHSQSSRQIFYYFIYFHRYTRLYVHCCMMKVFRSNICRCKNKKKEKISSCMQKSHFTLH